MRLRPHRPNSVTFLAIISFATTALYLVLIYLLWREAVDNFYSPSEQGPLNTLAVALGVSAAISILVGVGLLMMQRWARRLGLVLYILSGISQVIVIFTGGFSIYSLVGLVISIIFVGILNSGGVKEAFEPDSVFNT